jgi:hypothetical protein
MKCFLFISLFIGCLHLSAQVSSGYVSGMLNYGNIILHSQDLRPIGASYPIGISVDYGKHKSSQKAWDACNCYPRSGVSLSFWDFDNREVLGYGITGMYYIQPVFGAKNRLSFSLRAAAGLSYQSKPHDEEKNPDNLSYSTYLAIPLQLGLAAHFRLNKQWTIDLQGVLNHISNGGLNEPNKGINWPTVGLGVSRYFKVPEFKDRAKNDWHETVNELDRIDINTFTTYHSPNSGKYVFSWGMEGKYLRRVSRLSNLSIGSEYMFDNQKAETASDGIEISGHNLGLAIGHEFVLGRILFAQQFAAYLIKPESQKNDVYQRYTLVYRISKRFNAGVGLKSHGHVADFGDFRIGLSF